MHCRFYVKSDLLYAGFIWRPSSLRCYDEIELIHDGVSISLTRCWCLLYMEMLLYLKPLSIEKLSAGPWSFSFLSSFCKVYHSHCWMIWPAKTVGRNQSLACLDPPSPESLRNCGARSDKPLICWLRECRQAMLRWWQPVRWGGGGLRWLNASVPGSHVNFSVSWPLSHGRPLNRKCNSLQAPKIRGLTPCPHDTAHAG